MNELIDPKTLMRVSKFATQINRSVAWVHMLAKDKLVEMIDIDGYHFIVINEKSRKYLK